MALTSDLTGVRQIDGAIMLREYLATDTTAFFASGSVNVDTTTGLALPATDAANRVFVGICDERKTTGTTENVRVRCGGDFVYPATSIAQTMVGATMYIVDDEEMDDVAGVAQNVIMGRLTYFISTTQGHVNITCPELLATAGTLVSFATGATVVRLAALASVTVSAAIDELYENIDDVFCEDGDGVTTVSPGADRAVFAKAVNALGCGVSIRVRGDGAGTTATYLLSASADYAADGIPIVSDADPLLLSRQPDFYGPDAIGAGVNGWAYQLYRQLNSGIDTQTLATGDFIHCGAAGIPAIAKVGAAGGSILLVGKCLSSALDGEILFILPPQPNPLYTEAHIVTAGEDAANLVDIDTGWGVNPITYHYQITRAGIIVSGDDEVVTIGTGGAGTVRIADGAANYVLTQNDVVYFTCFRF